MTATKAPIRPEMTMEQILAIAPSAQRALFQRYHVGGCSSCGFQPSDTLSQVCKDHNILDVADVIRTIEAAQDLDGQLQIEPEAVKAWLESGEEFTFIDVREAHEIARSRILQAEPLDLDDPGRYMGLPKDRRIVFHCQTGPRSLDVAAYFKGQGFTQVFSLRGGIEAWTARVGPSLPRD